MLAVGILELVTEPVEAFVKAVSTCCAGCLDVPVAVTQRVQAKLVSDLCGVHSVWQVLHNKHRPQTRKRSGTTRITPFWRQLLCMDQQYSIMRKRSQFPFTLHFINDYSPFPQFIIH